MKPNLLFLGLLLPVLSLSSHSYANLVSKYLLYPDQAEPDSELIRRNQLQTDYAQNSYLTKKQHFFTGERIKYEGIEYFHFKSISKSDRSPDHRVTVLYFTGNAGGASYGSPWQDLYPLNWEVDEWTVSYPGFSGSDGKPDIKSIPKFSEKAFRFVESWHRSESEFQNDQRPFLIAGYSLGTSVALSLGKNKPATGLLLYNPPAFPDILHLHVSQVVGSCLQAFASPLIWFNFPRALNSVEAAKANYKPSVIISGVSDDIAPPTNQQKLIDSYKGLSSVFRIDHLGHVPESIRSQKTKEAIRESMEALVSGL